MPPKRKAAKTSAPPVKTEPAEDVDWSKETVAKLKAKCTELGLEATGKKQELVDRILEYLDNDDEDVGPPAKLKKQSTIQKVMNQMKADVKKEKKRQKHYKPDEHAPSNLTEGESGATAIASFTKAEDAIKAFEKKFTDKTKNKWAERAKFKPAAGKYTLIEMGGDDEEEEEEQKTTVVTKNSGGPLKPVKTKASTLDAATQQFVNFIFNNDMFREAMVAMEIDVEKLPLGKLSKSQIMKGFGVLDELGNVIRGKKKGNMTELSSKFYTIVPHSFGRKIPTVINSESLLQSKLDMLLTLGDIEIAQDMVKQSKEVNKTDSGENPVDTYYNLLNCTLTHVKKGEKEFQVLERYMEATNDTNWRRLKVLNIWRMDRGESEAKRFKLHDKLDNRKLLWHGTNVAVVAAILKSGLRIMPHAGGRVGRGLYFASENSKSAGYVGTSSKNTGVMFLNEVVLGKEKQINRDDHTLRSAPNGFHSVVARGVQEPDPKHDEVLEFDGKKVIVPVGKPVPQSKWSNSNFSQSEYLVYQESQVRMRYVLELKFGN